MFIYSTTFETPLGRMIGCANLEGICLLEFDDHENLEQQREYLKSALQTDFIEGANDHLDQLSEELEAYFSKKLRSFQVPLVMSGTDFQKKVWNELITIPFGKTISYLELTQRLGDPNAIRAVAGANGANKIAILIPCHRVIGADGSLTGYAGGLWRKQWLLEHESKQLHFDF